MVDKTNNIGASPLYLACLQGHTEVATTLIAANADVNRACDDGGTPLLAAFQGAYIEIVCQHAKTLLAANADANLSNEDGFTPLHKAREGHTEVVTMLLAANAKVNQASKKDAGFQTPLHMACHNGHAEVVTTLPAANASLEQAKDMATLLHFACSRGYTEIAADAARREGRREPGDHPATRRCK